MNNNKRPKSQGNTRNTPSKGPKKSFKSSSDKRSSSEKSPKGKDFKSSGSSFKKNTGKEMKNDGFQSRKPDRRTPRSGSESSDGDKSKDNYKASRSFSKNKDFRKKSDQADSKSPKSFSKPKRSFGSEKKYSDKFSSENRTGRKFSKPSERKNDERPSKSGGKSWGSDKKSGKFSDSNKGDRPFKAEGQSFDRDKKYSSKFDSDKKRESRSDKSSDSKKGDKPSFGGKSFDKDKKYPNKFDSDKKRESRSDKSADFKKGDKPSFGSKSFDKDKKYPTKFNSDKKREGRSERFSDSRKEEKSSSGRGRDKKSGKYSESSKRTRTSFGDSKDSAPKTPVYNIKKTSKGKPVSDKSSDDGKIRLNRFIANSGVCSRREADNLIELGEVSVNGVVITELGYKVNRTDQVRYSGRLLKSEKPVYVLLNKPKDFLTTTDDPQERRTVMSLVEKACNERIYPVGRLDRNTTGLLLLTNDGELAEKLTHPSNKIKKVYQAELDNPITKEDFQKILDGLELEDGPVQVDEIAVVSSDKKTLGLEIHEGRNRIVRRIFEHLGYEVVKLDRVMYAGLTKQDLPRGNWRYLTEKEVIRLKFNI